MDGLYRFYTVHVRSWNLLITPNASIFVLAEVHLHCFSLAVLKWDIFRWQEGNATPLTHVHLVSCTDILYIFSTSSQAQSLCSCAFLSAHPAHDTLTLLWAIGEPQRSRLHRGRQNGGDVGLAQPSVDYDVDSNPEGWTERLRVKGLHRLWALARWTRYRQPQSLCLHLWSFFLSVFI